MLAKERIFEVYWLRLDLATAVCRDEEACPTRGVHPALLMPPKSHPMISRNPRAA